MGSNERVKKLLEEAQERGIYFQLTGSGLAMVMDIRDLIEYVAEELRRNGIPLEISIDYEKHKVSFVIPMDYIRSVLQRASPRDVEAIKALIDLLGG